MNEYQDKWGRYHDKPCHMGEPSSNNGWIYSAYADVLGKDLKRNILTVCFQGCVRKENPLKIDRSPNRMFPPISKDEIVGMVHFRLVYRVWLKESHWNFCNLPEYEQKPLSFKVIIKALIAAWKIRKEHRNHFWQNQILAIYPLAFRLMPWDVFYVKRYFNKKAAWHEALAFALNYLFVLMGSNNSIRNLTWLQCKDLGFERLAKWLNQKKSFMEYFGENHPFNKENI